MENYEETLFNFSKPNEDNNFNYYHQYCRLYLANVVLTSQMKQLMAQKNQLQSKLARLQERNQEIQGSEHTIEKNKRHRRTANEINRHYKCSVEICQKSYGSEGSLNQHIKLKHPEIFATMSFAHCSNSQQQEQSSVALVAITTKHTKKGQHSRIN